MCRTMRSPLSVSGGIARNASEAVNPLLVRVKGDTYATPGTFATLACTVPGSPRVTIVTGLRMPGPIAFAIRSIALRTGSDLGRTLVVRKLAFVAVTPMEHADRKRTALTRITQRRRRTRSANPRHRAPLDAAREAIGSVSRSMRGPRRSNTAGTRVSAVPAAIAAASDAPTAMDV